MAKDPKTSTTAKGLNTFSVDPRLLKWIGVLGLELVLLVTVGFVVLVPKWNEIQKMQRDLKENQTIVRSLQQKVTMIETFDVEIKNRYGFMLTDVILAEKDLGVLLGSVNQLAARTGTQVVNYSLKPGDVFVGEADAIKEKNIKGKAASTLEEVNMELVIAGSSNGITDFLKLVDASLPLKEVQDIAVKSAEGGTGEVFELKIDLNVFRLPVASVTNATEVLKPITDEDLALANQLASFVRYEVAAPSTSSAELGNGNLFGL